VLHYWYQRGIVKVLDVMTLSSTAQFTDRYFGRYILFGQFPPITSPFPGKHSLCSDWLRAGRPRGRSSSHCTGRIFLLTISSRPVLGLTQPPIQWVPGVKRPGMKLTTHLHLVPRSRIRESIHPLPHTSHRDNFTFYHLPFIPA
jgi:hypothetical protein